MNNDIFYGNFYQLSERKKGMFLLNSRVYVKAKFIFIHDEYSRQISNWIYCELQIFSLDIEQLGCT